MRTHNIKLSHNFADAVYEREKTFEIRLNDRGYQTGDLIQFTVVDDSGLKRTHCLNGIIWQITYVLCGWGLKDNYCVFAFEPYIEPRNKHELDDIDLIELKDRFGAEVYKVVQDMLTGGNKRWKDAETEA